MSKYESFGFTENKSIEEMFPVGKLAKTLEKLITPTGDLPEGSEVTIEKIEPSTSKKYSKEWLGWIVVKDSDGIQWSIRPKHLKTVEKDPKKSGRYYILKQNNKK